MKKKDLFTHCLFPCCISPDFLVYVTHMTTADGVNVFEYDR
jgi:hypothetical protein